MNDKKILAEIRKLELKMFEDVERTANKLNAERRNRLLPKKVYTTYPDNEKTTSFKNELNISTTIRNHIKNGHTTECA